MKEDPEGLCTPSHHPNQPIIDAGNLPAKITTISFLEAISVK
jgi:hypothetical protein